MARADRRHCDAPQSVAMDCAKVVLPAPHLLALIRTGNVSCQAPHSRNLAEDTSSTRRKAALRSTCIGSEAMATTYHLQRDLGQQPPLSFRELVLLVRDETVGPDDFVCADWNGERGEWQPAATVVGLFYMAGRSDVMERWEAERRAEAERLASMESALDDLIVADGNSTEGAVLPDSADEVAGAGPFFPGSDTEFNDVQAARLQREMADLVDQSVADADAREAARQPGRLRRLASLIFSRRAVTVSFRWICTFAIANLVGYAIWQWSQREMQRFPSAKMLDSQIREFPFWDPCPPIEYNFLLVDVMLMTGVAVYIGLRIIESMAEE